MHIFRLFRGWIRLIVTLLIGGSLYGTSQQKNILFISVDDLRPAMECYGVEQARTPHMDALAKSGRLFKKHYVQVPTCGASRHSMLTGRYPRSRAEIKNSASRILMDVSSNLPRSMPELFRKNGYTTVCIGKISHMPDGLFNGTPELPGAWDEMSTPFGPWKEHGSYQLLFSYANGATRKKGHYEPLYEFPDVEDNELPDGMLAETAVQRLEQFAREGNPFFMGVGFYKPHLPFVAPRRYKDLYDGINFPSPYEMQRGDTQRIGKSNEFYSYTTPFERPEKNQTLSEAEAQEARRAYHACVSYVDAQVGKLLQTLEKTGLAENTIVVLWGDHGWHLGEHNAWAKHTPMNYSLRSSFIMRVPGQRFPGTPTNSLAASIDIYPTLVDLCSLEKRETYKPLEGISLRPILADPNESVRSEVLSFWYATSLNDGRYHLIVSENQEGSYNADLYDLQNDPGELVNVAALQPEVMKRLMQQLRSAYPQIILE
ncbi:MAG: sulfatase [Coraliomargaritaceae bacterium]